MTRKPPDLLKSLVINAHGDSGNVTEQLQRAAAASLLSGSEGRCSSRPGSSRRALPLLRPSPFHYAEDSPLLDGPPPCQKLSAESKEAPTSFFSDVTCHKRF